MSNSMNFVGDEQEQFLQNPLEQHNFPGCWCNGVPFNQWMSIFKGMIGEVFDEKLHPILSSLPRQPEPSVSTTFRLCLQGTMPDTILTKDNIEDQGALLELQLCDDTGKRLEEVDPKMKNLKVEILALDGFKFDDSDNFTVDDFNRHVAIPRDDKPPLLKGDCEISLHNGFARVHGISFTDNSTTRSHGKFKLGARVIKDRPFVEVVRPAVSKAFQVKEYRLKADQKHPIPLPQDDISRLINITKKGIFYHRAVAHEILTVLDFLQLYYTDAAKLQDHLKLTGKKWKETVKNAEACDLTNELYKYEYSDVASGDVLLLSCAFKIESVTFKDQTSQPYEFLNQFQKERICKLRKTAYEKRKELRKVDTSINKTPIQAGLRYDCHVEQPATAPFGMDSNVGRPWESAAVAGVSSYNINSTSSINTVTDQGSFGQLSPCFNTGAYGGSSTNVAIGNMAQQFPNNGLALQISDLTEANQAHFQQVGMSTSACSSAGIHGVTFRSQTSQQYNIQKVHNPMYQMSIQNELTLSSGNILQHCQGHHQPATTPNSFSEYPNSDGHAFNQMCSIPPSNYLHVNTTAPFQGDSTGIACDFSAENGCFKRQNSWDSDDIGKLLNDLANPSLQEESSNVSIRDSVTSKLITTCYVTKAATLFMISFQQKPASASPTKKRKLQ